MRGEEAGRCSTGAGPAWFAVLEVDNRGMGGRGREFQQAAYHTFGPTQFADQMASLDQMLAADKRLDPARVGWWGWSWEERLRCTR